MAIIQQLLIHGVQQTHITFEASTVGATTNFVVPTGVTNISIMAVGGGGGGSTSNGNSGACGGGLVWTDDVSVTPGETLVVCVGPGGVGSNVGGATYNDSDGHTSYVQRQSNNQFIVKAYGGGYAGQYGGEGMFTEGNGVIKTGGDGHNTSRLGNNGWPQTQWQQAGSNAYKGQTGGGRYSQGMVGVPLSPVETGGLGGAATGTGGTGPATGGVGGLYGGAGGNGTNGSYGQTGYGGSGGDGGVRISWDTPIGGGTPNIDGTSSVQFKGSYNYQYLIVTPPTPNYFQLGDSDWTMEFWWRPYGGAPSQSYWSNGGVGSGCPFIEGLDENNKVTWKIAPAQTNSVGWYHQNQANKDAYGGNGEDAELRWYLGGDHLLTHGGDSENGSDGWRQVVFERIGTGLYLFMTGSRTHQYSGSNSDLFQFGNMPDLNDTSTKRIAIGGHGKGSGSSAAIGGQISNVRVVTGRAVYGQDTWNTNHIKPVKQIPDTKLLACNGSTVDTFYLGLDENTVVGQKEYTVAGTYSWTCPANVTSVSVVAVGGGGGSSTPNQTWTGSSGNPAGDGGGGGGLGYKNNISVTAGQTYTVVVDAGTSDGGNSYFINTSTVRGGGASGTSGGSYAGDGGGNGGGASSGVPGVAEGGGGGAGGYSGNGGNGMPYSGGYQDNNSAGSGGGGHGGGGLMGGGVGILGEGASGSSNAQGGSGGENGGNNNTGGKYGGGGRADNTAGAVGAVRIIWPGSVRQFPSTRTADE